MGSTPTFGNFQAEQLLSLFLSECTSIMLKKTLSKRISLNNIQIVLIALLIIGGRLVINFSQRIIEGQEKLAEQNRLEAEISALQEENRNLEALKIYYNSPAFVEAWAHHEGKMVRPNETLIIPIYNAPTETQQIEETSERVPIKEDIPTWLVWWSLFFENLPNSNLTDLDS